MVDVQGRWFYMNSLGVHRDGSRKTECTLFKKWFQSVVSESTGCALSGHGCGLPRRFCFFLLLQVWQCSGRVKVLPCSRVAHLERHHKPYSLDLSIPLKQNALRVAEIWMDEYKDMVYKAWNTPLQVRPGLEQKQRWMKEEEVVVTAGNGKG